MKPWASFHPHVLPDVIGCPIPTVDHALRDAAREFCLTTSAWQETEEVQADAGQTLFDFETPNGAELVKVIRASVAGKDLSIFSVRSLPADWATNTPAAGLYHASTAEYMLFPLPSVGQSIVVTLAVRPGTAGTGVSDDVFSRHAEDIAAGAKARLKRSPRKDWTDLTQAAIDQAVFDRAMHWAANMDFIQTKHADRRVKTWG